MKKIAIHSVPLSGLSWVGQIFNSSTDVNFKLQGLMQFQDQNTYSTQNHAYFSIVLIDRVERLKVQKSLNEKQIFLRRYFYPSVDTLNYIEPKQYSPILREISNSILVLPVYTALEETDQMKIINILKENLLHSHLP